MTNKALDHALALIGDTFRPERKVHCEILLQGHRVKALVDADRYEFTKACKLLDVHSDKLESSFAWLLDDNARMNGLYDYVHEMSPLDYIVVGWFKDMEAAKIVQLRGIA